MAVIRNYKSGAVIYFKGDNSKEVYVLKSGAMTLTYRGVETTAYVTEKLRVGDFFGVKSVVGNYKREETAQVIEEASVLILSKKEFEELASKNVSLVLKMLKIFSTQLRRIGKQAAALISTTGEMGSEASISLFKIGEYYLKNKKLDHAKYVFHKYIEAYPNGEFIQQAKERIQLVQKGIAGGEIELPREDKGQSESQDLTGETLKDFDPNEIYEEAIAYVNGEKYSEAVNLFNKIEEKNANIEDKEILEKSAFEKSKCYFEMGEYETAIGSFTNFIKANPKTEKMKLALMFIGKSCRLVNDDERAKNFFKKVAALPPEDEISEEANKTLEEIH